jgi:hypothetical protein
MNAWNMRSALDSGRKAVFMGILASAAAIAAIVAGSMILAIGGNGVTGSNYSADAANTANTANSAELAGPAAPASNPPVVNPWGRKIDIEFTVPSQGTAIVRVFDNRGAQVANLFHGRAEAGERIRVSMRTDGLAPGAHFSRLDYQGGTVTKAIPLVYRLPAAGKVEKAILVTIQRSESSPAIR